MAALGGGGGGSQAGEGEVGQENGCGVDWMAGCVEGGWYGKHLRLFRLP